jgi:hypothetical protein
MHTHTYLGVHAISFSKCHFVVLILFLVIERQPWLFTTSTGFQELSEELRAEYLKWVEYKMCIAEPLEWYEVANRHMIHYKGIWGLRVPNFVIDNALYFHTQDQVWLSMVANN